MSRRLLERVQLTIHDKQRTVPLGSTLYVISTVYTLKLVTVWFRKYNISRDICTRFGRYLYFTKCGWIIKDNIRAAKHRLTYIIYLELIFPSEDGTEQPASQLIINF